MRHPSISTRTHTRSNIHSTRLQKTPRALLHSRLQRDANTTLRGLCVAVIVHVEPFPQVISIQYSTLSGCRTHTCPMRVHCKPHQIARVNVPCSNHPSIRSRHELKEG